MPWGLSPIAKVSPSGANTLLSCPLRYICDQQRRVKRPSIPAILGTVGHAVLEWAGKLTAHSGEDFQRRCEAVWDKALLEELSKLNSSPFFPQISDFRRWPGYALKKRRVLRLAESIVPLSQARPASGAGRGPLVETFVENELFRGKLDRVEFRESGPTLIDWKSTLDLEDEQKQRTYETQLLIYASLLRGNGIHITNAELVTFAGDRFTKPVAEAEVTAIEGTFRQKISETNQKVLTGQLSDLAVPGQACSYCDHKVGCRKFWNASPSLVNGAEELRGKFLNLAHNSAGTSSAITVEVQGRPIEVLGIPTALCNSEWVDAKGSEIRLDGLRPFGDSGEKYYATIRTHISVEFGY